MLVVDSDPAVRLSVRNVLEGRGLAVTDVSTARAALAVVQALETDIVLTELTLPDMSGLDLCRIVRRESDVPLFVLTAMREEADKVLALEIGADDYLTKPYREYELVLRIKAILRRAGWGAPARTATSSDTPPSLVLDAAMQAVLIRDRAVALSQREYHLLEVLWRAGGRVLTHEQLLHVVWGDAQSDPRVLVAQIRRLRNKVEDDPQNPALILTVRGRGYRVAL